MPDPRQQRRLAAIVVADVVGYSRLMEDDESGTIATFKRCRAEIMEPLLLEFGGRAVKFLGDGALMEFPSAVDAVEFAVAFQTKLTGRNNDPSNQSMIFRVGINVGEIIIDAGDVLGDGVNIAARLESLAEPGRILISEAVFGQVKGKTPVLFKDLGEQSLKNMSPVRTYVVEIPGSNAPSAEATLTHKRTSNIDKISIAILPFENMSGDKEQDYFSDGITEDIITELSRFRELRVVARNSSFSFRGQSIDVTEIARKLGVQFVVEGSVRKSGNRLRITAQLIEGGSDRHVWAERYDRDLNDVFAIQGEISQTIASIVAGHVKTAGAARTKARPTDSLSAYDLFLRARSLFSRYGTNEERLPLLIKAIELDPDFAMAHALLANALLTVSLYNNDFPMRERAAEFARRAIALDPDEPWGHGILGYCMTFLGKMPEAGMHLERARRLNPNDVMIAVFQALWHCFAGHTDQAITGMQEALKLDPFGHEWYWDDYCIVLVVAQRYEEAAAAYEKMVAPAPWSYAFASIAHINLGNVERARDLAQRAFMANPSVSVEDYFGLDPYVDRAVPERLIADFKKAL